MPENQKPQLDRFGVAAALQERLVVVVQVAEAFHELDGTGGRVF